jgi:hypothetical protein
MALTKVTYSMIEGAAVNVLDYGADPAGTDDSTAAIQAALTFVAANGGCLYIPAGNYKLTNTLTVSAAANSFAIVGDNEGASNLIRSADYGSVLSISASNNWRICDISIDAKHDTYSNGNHGIVFFNCSFVEIERVKVNNWKNSAIIGYVDPAGPSSYGFVVLRDCYVDGENSSNNGILLADYNDSGFINCSSVNIGKTGSPCYALQFKENCNRCYMIGGTATGASIGVACGNSLSAGDAHEDGRIIGVNVFNCETGIAFGNSRKYVVDSCIVDMNSAGNHALDFNSGSSGHSVRNLKVLNLATAKAAVRCRSNDTDNTVEVSSIYNDSNAAEKAALFDASSLRNSVELGLYAKPITIVSTTNIVDNLSNSPTNTFKYQYIPQLNILTIASGVVSLRDYAVQYVRIDTEGAAATDDLDTINNGTDRQTIILQSSSSLRDVVLKSGTGNLVLAGLADFTLTSTADTIMLMYNAALAKWCEVSRSTNA